MIDVELTPHTVSIEKLYHFRCGECEAWWTIADWQPVQHLACPHCGLLREAADCEE